MSRIRDRADAVRGALPAVVRQIDERLRPRRLEPLDQLARAHLRAPRTVARSSGSHPAHAVMRGATREARRAQPRPSRCRRPHRLRARRRSGARRAPRARRSARFHGARRLRCHCAPVCPVVARRSMIVSSRSHSPASISACWSPCWARGRSSCTSSRAPIAKSPLPSGQKSVEAVELDREARIAGVGEHAFVDRPRAARCSDHRHLELCAERRRADPEAFSRKQQGERPQVLAQAL